MTNHNSRTYSSMRSVNYQGRRCTRRGFAARRVSRVSRIARRRAFYARVRTYVHAERASVGAKINSKLYATNRVRFSLSRFLRIALASRLRIEPPPAVAQRCTRGRAIFSCVTLPFPRLPRFSHANVSPACTTRASRI